MSSFLYTACAVCFGDPSSPLSKGVAAGVAFLIVVVGGVLSAIVITAYRWARRARQLKGPS